MVRKEAGNVGITPGNMRRRLLLPVYGQCESEASGLFVRARTEQTDLTGFGWMVANVLNMVARLGDLRKSEQCHQRKEHHIQRGATCHAPH